MVQTHLAVEFEAAGFDSEEQKRWRRQDAVKRRTVFGSWVRGLGEFGVVFDSSGAEELGVCVCCDCCEGGAAPC